MQGIYHIITTNDPYGMNKFGELLKEKMRLINAMSAGKIVNIKYSTDRWNLSAILLYEYDMPVAKETETDIHGFDSRPQFSDI